MRAEWVRVYKVGDDVATFLHLYADDDSELVALTEDEIRLVELAIRSEQHEDRHSAARRAFTEAYALVIRGPKSRVWGFYPPEGFVDQHRYDYATRRPVHEER